MRNKILNRVLGFFGLLGFAMVFGGAIGAYADYRKGVIVALIGAVIMILVILGNHLLIRLLKRASRLPLDKRGRKALGLKF